MTQRLPYPDERTRPDPRGDLDRDLEVAAWTSPGDDRRHAPVSAEEADRPAWWRGEEEAAQTVLRELGLDPGR